MLLTRFRLELGRESKVFCSDLKVLSRDCSLAWSGLNTVWRKVSARPDSCSRLSCSSRLAILKRFRYSIGLPCSSRIWRTSLLRLGSLLLFLRIYWTWEVVWLLCCVLGSRGARGWMVCGLKLNLDLTPVLPRLPLHGPVEQDSKYFCRSLVV
jgi:hypothetical protein